MKLIFISTILTIVTAELAIEKKCILPKGYKSCEFFGVNQTLKKIKNTKFCLDCQKEYYQVRKLITCDGESEEHSSLINNPQSECTMTPTESPTISPTLSPTVAPTNTPTESPTIYPTDSPTISPTISPTGSPTVAPTDSPTISPTVSPTVSPTQAPTKPPFIVQFKEKCSSTAKSECKYVKFHAKKKAFDERGTRICKIKKGACSITKESKNWALRLDKN